MKINRWLLAAVFILMLAFASPAAGQAPSVGPGWSDPEDISNMPTNSAYPKVLAGPDGVVHVFWTENIPQYGAINNVIYYARLDSIGWSQPVDILISPQGLSAKADQPDAVLGKDGDLHVVFTGGWNGQIYYAQAKAGSALDSRSWSKPVLISKDVSPSSNPNILEDTQGNLYIIFQADQGYQQGLYETESTDNGESWSQVSLIPGTTLSSDTLLMDTRAAISAKGVIHVTWAWTTLEESFPPQRNILYSFRRPRRDLVWGADRGGWSV